MPQTLRRAGLAVALAVAASFGAAAADASAATAVSGGRNNWSCKPSAAHPNPVVVLHGFLGNADNDLGGSLGTVLKQNSYCEFDLTYGRPFAAIPIGALPGPGGIVVFAVGLAMVLKTSMWAKRRYVKFKRWQPKAGRWADWGLRRRSARRREELRKAISSPAQGREATPPPTPVEASPATPSDSRDN